MGDDLFASLAVCGINISARWGQSAGGWGQVSLACSAPAGTRLAGHRPRVVFWVPVAWHWPLGGTGLLCC